MQSAVVEIRKLPPLPAEDSASVEEVEKYEKLIREIKTPVSNDEARVLVKMFGMDGCFGLAASLIQRIETAPDWPLVDCFENSENPWILELLMRSRRGLS